MGGSSGWVTKDSPLWRDTLSRGELDLQDSFEMPPAQPPNHQDVEKRGLRLRGIAFMTILTVLAVLESTLPSLSYKTKDREATVTALTVLAVRQLWWFRS